jgi:hypothetical protein
MNIMLDKSAEQIWHCRAKYDIEFEQLRTPLTQYRPDQCNIIQYGLDNGAFTNFDEDKWLRMANEAEGSRLCKWVVLPDVVGDAEKTTDNFWKYYEMGFNSKAAYVIQNGITEDMMKDIWPKIKCVFVGGDDVFKDGLHARQICVTAKQKNKLVHVGRVNSPIRFSSWFDLADSVDGSGISRFTGSLEKLVRIIHSYENTTQRKLNVGL